MANTTLILELLAASVAVLLVLCATAMTLHLSAWLHLLWLRRRPALALPEALPADERSPRLLLQLPLYNEASVVEELLRSVSRLEWPRDRFRVQVLDDSTDETPQLVAGMLGELRAGGLEIEHVRRDNREGFKAGALARGLELSDEELVAILDADFRPSPDWLRRAVACLLAGPEVGLLQCPWGFDNPDENVLTRAQSLHLDAHFALEQTARHSGGLLFGFNGTAGVWRRRCIEDAGGWDGDTLTEDLDLSYRAQLAGWSLRYEDRLPVACELPSSMAAVRAQQHRWIRGGAQVARKLLVRLWQGEQPLRRRLHGTAHLLASSVFLPVLLTCSLTPALPFLQPSAGPVGNVLFGVAGWLFRVVLCSLVLAHLTVCVSRAGGLVSGLGRFLRDFPVYLLLATGIAVHDAHAAWLGWRGPTGTFVRTPKGRALAGRQRLPGTVPWELALVVWTSVGFVGAVLHGQWGIAPFLALQAAAFGLIAGRSVVEASPRGSAAPRPLRTAA